MGRGVVSVLIQTSHPAPLRKALELMRRIVMLLTVALVMGAMMVLAGPASAQGGCQDFGLFVAEGAHLPGAHSGVAEFAPNVDDLISSLKGAAGC